MSSRYLVHSINKLGTGTSVILRGSQRRFSIPLLWVKLRSSYRYLYFNGCGQDFIQSESVPMAENWRHLGFVGEWFSTVHFLHVTFSFLRAGPNFHRWAFHLLVGRINSTLFWEFVLISIRTTLMVLNIKVWVCILFPFVPNRKRLVSILQVLSGFIESSEEETIGHGIFYNSQPVLEEQIAACNHGRNRNLFGSRSFEAAPPRVWKWNAWWILWFRLKFKSYLLR